MCQFLLSIQGTNWFQETISSVDLDYDVVCPYSSLGCRHTCLRTELEEHLANNCRFNKEPHDSDDTDTQVNLVNISDTSITSTHYHCQKQKAMYEACIGKLLTIYDYYSAHSCILHTVRYTRHFSFQAYASEYEVVCPNTILGCDHSCSRSSLAQHLDTCRFSGNLSFIISNPSLF